MGWVPQGHASGVNLNALGIILAGFGQENNSLLDHHGFNLKYIVLQPVPSATCFFIILLATPTVTTL